MGKENQILGQKYLEINSRIRRKDNIASNLKGYGQAFVLVGASFT